MNYITEAIERLEEYDQLHTAVENIKQELFALKAESDLIKSRNISDMPKGSRGVADDWLCNNIAKRKELSQRLEISQRRIKQVEIILGKLESDERKLVDILYIRGGKKAVDRAMEELNFEKTKIYDMRNMVTKKIARMMLGIGIE